MFIGEKVDYFDSSGLMCDRFGEVYRWFLVDDSNRDGLGYLASVFDVLTERQASRKEAQQKLLQWEHERDGQEPDDLSEDEQLWDDAADSMALEVEEAVESVRCP